MSSFLGVLVALGVVAFLGWWLWADWASFCGLLNMVTFDGDVGIVFVEAYNYLSEFEYFGVNYLSELDILV